ncbi:MAG: hypothetical protein FJ096_11435 [Deltaproteobacteria bacterium]|nr:hypothetical protein [Deltaproteobacteria bacterium]
MLKKLATAGQTGAPIDVTKDNTQLAAALEKIRSDVAAILRSRSRLVRSSTPSS